MGGAGCSGYRSLGAAGWSPGCAGHPSCPAPAEPGVCRSGTQHEYFIFGFVGKRLPLNMQGQNEMTLMEQFALLCVRFCCAAGAWGGSGRVARHTALCRLEQLIFQRLSCVLEGYLRLSVEIVEDLFVGWLFFLEEL